AGGGGDPQRGQVGLRAQEPPEAEARLCAALAVDLGNAPTGCSVSGRLDVVESPGAMLAREELTSPVPGPRPLLRCAVGDEGLVHGVSEHASSRPMSSCRAPPTCAFQS